MLAGYDFMNVDIIELLIIFYFSGMVIGRLGSLLVEPFLEKVKFISKCDHKSFVHSEQKDKKISSISESNNIYRSMITVIFISLIVKLYRSAIELNWDFGDMSEWLLLIALLILFLFAYRKQTSYLISRIDYHIK